MFGECHAHLFMDGVNYRDAVKDHENGVNIGRVREHLQAYKDAGVSFVRDGGDRYGVSAAARKIAGEYGITYLTPLFAVFRKGHYGGIVGRGAQTLADYAALVKEVRALGGDFIKIMVSGIMDYREFGRLSEEPLSKEWISQMIQIAHAEGFAVMVHANGSEAVRAAALAGADSIEHGNYIDRSCIEAMADTGCIFVPTIATTGNLLGCGRYDDGILRRIYDMECENLARAYEAGVTLALGSDAGAYLVPHGKGIVREYEIFSKVCPAVSKEELHKRIWQGEEAVRRVFGGAA